MLVVMLLMLYHQIDCNIDLSSMQQKLAIILALAAAALLLANHQPSDDHYLIWKEQFGIQYTPQ